MLFMPVLCGAREGVACLSMSSVEHIKINHATRPFFAMVVVTMYKHSKPKASSHRRGSNSAMTRGSLGPMH